MEVLLQKENANAAGHPPAQHTEIMAIPKPRGEAGSQGFKWIREIGLDDTAENKRLYCAIMVRGKKQSCDCHHCDSLSWQTVCDSIIKSSIDLSLNFQNVDLNDLSAIFKMVSTKASPCFYLFFGSQNCCRLRRCIHTC